MRRWTLPILIAAMVFAGLSTSATAKGRKARHGSKAPAEAVSPDTEAANEADSKAPESAEPTSPTPQPSPDGTEEKPAGENPEAEPVAPPAPPKPAQLQIFCPLPGADVLVDDVVVGKTPLADAVIVSPGKHAVEVKRPGYMSSWREITITEGAQRSVAFHPDEDPESDDPRGRLVVSGGAGDVRVTIDGRPRGKYQKPIDVPAGPHHVRMDRKGFEPVEQLVDVPAGDAVEVGAPAKVTEQVRAASQAHTQTYKQWALVALISGVVVAGGSTGVALWGNSKIGGAQDDLAKVKQENDADGCNNPDTPSVRMQLCQQKLSAAQSDLDKYRSWRTRGIIGAGVGAALVATGVVLWLIAPDAGPQVRGEEPSEEASASRLLPVISAGPDGASLWLRGSF